VYLQSLINYFRMVRFCTKLKLRKRDFASWVFYKCSKLPIFWFKIALLNKSVRKRLFSNITLRWMSLYLKSIAQPISLPTTKPWLIVEISWFCLILRSSGIYIQMTNKNLIKYVPMLFSWWNDYFDVLYVWSQALCWAAFSFQLKDRI
jgi:hypothetical protein